MEVAIEQGSTTGLSQSQVGRILLGL